MKPSKLPYLRETHRSSITTEELLQKYVDVQAFETLCRQCPHYGTKWSCPPFEFNPLDWWHGFNRLEIICDRIIIPPVETAGYTVKKIELLKEVAAREAKRTLEERLLMLEKKSSRSIALFPGTCNRCHGHCQKTVGNRCISPDTLRYSIEALGGNVALMQKEIFGFELIWSKAGEIPPCYQLVGGLLS